MDGTLVNKQGNISPTDRLALAEARAAGVQIALCTGRVIGACRRILDLLDIKGPSIFFDGALVYDLSEQKTVFLNTLPPETLKTACDLASANNIPLDLCSFSDYYVAQKSWRTDLRLRVFGIEATVADFNTIWQRKDIIRGGMILNTSEEVKRVRDYAAMIRDRLYLSWSTVAGYPDHHFINVLDREVSKGRALEAMAAYLDIPLEQVIAIGDGTNDISLLEKAGLAVAMRNAPAALKEQADYVTADVEQNGVAEAVRRFIL